MAASMTQTVHSRPQVLTLAVLASLLVFASGFFTPSEVAHAILYVPAVVSSMWSPRRSDPFLVGALCTLLAALGVVLYPGADTAASHAMVNTPLATLAIWITAFGVRLRMTSEQELSDSDSELRAILETAIDGVITIDEDGLITSINPAGVEMFGYGKEELVGRNVSLLMPAPFEQEHDGYIRAYLESGQRKIIGIGREVVGLRKDRTAIPLDLGVSEWSDGSPRFTAILRDLSDRRQLEAEMRQAQKLEALGRFTGGIAHDFNNLLMGVISCCRIAKASEDAGEVGRQLEEIQKAAERGAAFTGQLLTFSRRREIPPEPILIDAVVEGLETMLRRLLGEEVDLSVELGAHHARVLIDPIQVEQILMNLAINSRDAMRQRGSLGVRTDVQTCDQAGVGGAGGVGVGRYVLIEVHDDGSGMTDDVQAKAFDPFFTTKPPGEGTGLGLSTVYGLVRQCGGHLHLTTAPDEGTRIAVHLPITEAHSTPRMGGGSAEAKGAEDSTGTVLLVEDDRLVRAGVRHLLAEMGHEVLVAGGGADALRICEEYPGEIDLLLTDIMMPGMTGVELAREVAARLPGVRRLYMSALPKEVLVEQGSIEEGEPAILKPFSDEQLAEAVSALL
ncbi:MAG: hybrid sensor histidine kinase/response regulator [Planctomycetes bacterium]|nr:hybrid sensor histidine kinase/response regulator [Planctomycetota bacterium]